MYIPKYFSTLTANYDLTIHVKLYHSKGTIKLRKAVLYELK